MGSRTPIEPECKEEAQVWERLKIRVRESAVQSLEWLPKGAGIPANGWYVSHQRPATLQEEKMYTLLIAVAQGALVCP